MSEPIIAVTGLVKRFGGFTALQEVDFTLAPGERVGLIGPNGSGKSTFVNCLTGTLAINAGAIHFDGTDITGMAAWRRARLGLARSFQIPRPFTGLTIVENLAVPLAYAAREHRPHQRLEEAHAILASIGLADLAQGSPRSLSQVDLRKLELGRALAARPKVLIADEALAGLSDHESDEILDLLLELNARGIAVILIEHIMRAVLRFSQRLVVLVAGQKIAEGAPQEVLAHPEVVRAYLGQ